MDYIEYFKNKPGFYRYFLGLKNKYESQGNFNGVVKLESITEEESASFSLFFGENFKVLESVSIPLKKFMNVISKSKFENFSLYDLVINYLDIKEIKTKKERVLEKEDEYRGFLEDTLNMMDNQEIISYLLKSILEKTATGKLLKTRYTKNKNQLRDTLLKIDKLLNNIPEFPTSMPIYASLTGNPHFLDFGSSTSSLFLRCLSGILNISRIETIDDKWNLLEKINVYSDAISNYCIVHNLFGHSELEIFFRRFGPLNINLNNIANLKKLYGLNDKIFIFENPSILNYFKDEPISIIITSGMPNLAFYRLMEKIDSKTKLYYNGDFDPEGLLIASKLKKLYPNLELFCYSSVDYNNTQANEVLEKSRINKLKSIDTLELREIKKAIHDTKMAGYQEKNLKRIEEYIKNEKNSRPVRQAIFKK